MIYEDDEKKLSPEQVENWRRVMLTIIGPVALFLPVACIQRYRDRMQEIADLTLQTTAR